MWVVCPFVRPPTSWGCIEWGMWERGGMRASDLPHFHGWAGGGEGGGGNVYGASEWAGQEGGCVGRRNVGPAQCESGMGQKEGGEGGGGSLTFALSLSLSLSLSRSVALIELGCRVKGDLGQRKMVVAFFVFSSFFAWKKGSWPFSFLSLLLLLLDLKNPIRD